MDQINSHTV